MCDMEHCETKTVTVTCDDDKVCYIHETDVRPSRQLPDPERNKQAAYNAAATEVANSTMVHV